MSGDDFTARKNKYFLYAIKQIELMKGHSKDPRTKTDKNGAIHRLCMHFIESKDRFCRLTAIKHSVYCAEHAEIDYTLEEKGWARVPCNYDRNHTVYRALLENHLRRCSSKPKTNAIFYSKGINKGTVIVVNKPICAAYISREELQHFLRRVTNARQSFPSIGESFGRCPLIDQELVRSDVGQNFTKHIAQIGSLISTMEEKSMLQSNTCYIEFGAGRAAFTYWLGRTLMSKGITNWTHLVFDKASPQHKQDNKLRELGVHVRRERINIQNIDLSKITEAQECDRIVAFAKHLCGAGTDLAFRCLFKNETIANKIHGIILATCCHNQCNISDFVCQNFREVANMELDEFNMLCKTASWSNSDIPGSRPGVSIELNEETLERYHLPNHRMLYGLAAKELIDFLRIRYLSSTNMEATLFKFTDLSTTLENMAIVATRPNVAATSSTTTMGNFPPSY